MTQPGPGRIQVPRNPRLDGCRLLASVSILYMHTFQAGHLPDAGEYGRFGVPFFTCSAFYLLMQSFQRRADRPFFPYLRNRFVRLYVPFLFWGALGLAMMDLKHRFITHQALTKLDAGFFLSGDSFQLWYLPFLLVAGVLMFPVCQGLAALREHRQPIAAMILIAAASMLFFVPPVVVAHPQSTWGELVDAANLPLQASPGILLGIATALIVRDRTVPKWLGAMGLVFTIAAMIYVRAVGRNLPLENLSGETLLVFALSGSGFPLPSLVLRYAYLAYGIYLAQNVVLEPIQTMVSRIGVRVSVPVEMAVFGLVLTASTLVSLLLARSRFTRWTLG